jgi:hypothetical protein
MDDFTGVVATSHVTHSLHPPSFINVRKAFFQNIPIRPMQISTFLLASFLALPKSLSASEAEGTLRGTERSLVTCRNTADWGGLDESCTSSLPICATSGGNQIGWHAYGVDCFKCLRVLDTSGLKHYGCTTVNPVCQAATGKAGKACGLAAAPLPSSFCTNTAVWAGQDAGCNSTLPICANADGSQLGASVSGVKCFKCLAVRDNGTPYPYNDYGCTTPDNTIVDAPRFCDAVGNTAGMKCMTGTGIPTP